MREFKKKKLEIEKWAEKGKKELKATTRQFATGCQKFNSLWEDLMKQQAVMKEQVEKMSHLRKSHSFDNDRLPLELNGSWMYGGSSARRLSVGVAEPDLSEVSRTMSQGSQGGVQKKRPFEYRLQAMPPAIKEEQEIAKEDN